MAFIQAVADGDRSRAVRCRRAAVWPR